MLAKTFFEKCCQFATAQENETLYGFVLEEDEIGEAWEGGMARLRALEILDDVAVSAEQVAELNGLKMCGWHLPLIQAEIALVDRLANDGLSLAVRIVDRLKGSALDPRQLAAAKRGAWETELLAMGFPRGDAMAALVDSHPEVATATRIVISFEQLLRGVSSAFAEGFRIRRDGLYLRLARARLMAQGSQVLI
jgi:hypothetical protein